MDTQALLNKPPTNPTVVAKVTKIDTLSIISANVRKTSIKLRKLFETNTYQKRTQLSVLNRYKKRLDSINKESEKKLEAKKKDKSKGILPKIKPFVGTFFKPNSDPLKSIAQLAAFNAATKLAKGDVLGTVGPGLTAAAILFGPKLLKMGGGALLKGITKSAAIAKAPPVQSRALGAGERAAARGVGEVAEGAGRGGLRFLGPVLNVALAAWDFQNRKSSGQTNLQAGLGAGAGAAGAWAGFTAGAALGAAIGSAFLGVGSVPGAIIGAVVGGVGAWLGGSLAGGVMDMITGAGKKTYGVGGNVSFSTSLDRYEKVVNKFSSYAFSSGGGEGNGGGGPLVPGEMQQVGQYRTGTLSGQQYGDPRPGGRQHAGVDLDLGRGDKQVTFLGGTVNYIGNNPGGYYTFVDIMTPTGYIERLAELGTLAPGIKVGARVAPGQVISSGEGPTGVTHLEYRRPGTSGISGTVNPLQFLKTQGVMTGTGRMNYRTAAASASPPPSSPPPRQRSVSSYTSYSPSPYRRGEVIPLPIPQQMQQMMQSTSSESMIMPGPSEQDLLNSFYKRVLLNTVA
jgi:hypothetical protein